MREEVMRVSEAGKRVCFTDELDMSSTMQEMRQAILKMEENDKIHLEVRKEVEDMQRELLRLSQSDIHMEDHGISSISSQDGAQVAHAEEICSVRRDINLCRIEFRTAVSSLRHLCEQNQSSASHMESEMDALRQDICTRCAEHMSAIDEAKVASKELRS